MHISKENFKSAAAQEHLSEQQADALWQALSMHDSTSKANVSQLFYYFGALLIIGAMGWFITNGWDTFSGGTIFIIACVYAILFGISGGYLWKDEQTRIPGGLLLTVGVCMIPLAIYGLEKSFGFWSSPHDPTIRNYFLMELGTIVGALIVLYFFRFPFLTAPLFFALWLMSLHIVPFLWGGTYDTDDIQKWTSLGFGMVLLVISYYIDQRTREDFAFWSYLFGGISFWLALVALLVESTEIKLALFFLINLLMIFLSIFLDRRLFLILGAIGVFYYLSHLATRIFEHSILFPFVLSLIGVVIMAFGILYSRHAKKIDQAILSVIPASLRKFRPSSRK